MKKSYLWFGLAVPAVVGGVSALLKSYKKNGSSSPLAPDKALPNVDNGSDILIPKPDLDKDLNKKTETASPASVRRKKMRETMQQEYESRKKNLKDKKIYTGAKGGKYYLNEKGEKIYLKKA